MCLICLEYQKQRMTIREAWRAYGEMAPGLDPKHRKEVKDMLEEDERKKKEEEENATP